MTTCHEVITCDICNYELNPRVGRMYFNLPKVKICSQCVSTLVLTMADKLQSYKNAYHSAGSTKSEAKARASRKNGKKGGRPKKS